MYVLAFLPRNLAKNQITQVDIGIAKMRLDQSQKEDKLGKVIFHDKL